MFSLVLCELLHGWHEYLQTIIHQHLMGRSTLVAICLISHPNDLVSDLQNMPSITVLCSFIPDIDK